MKIFLFQFPLAWHLKKNLKDGVGLDIGILSHFARDNDNGGVGPASVCLSTVVRNLRPFPKITREC